MTNQSMQKSPKQAGPRSPRQQPAKKLSGLIRPPSVAGDTIFSFETSGLEGGDGSYLDIVIQGGSAMMDLAIDGAQLEGGAGAGRSVAIRLMGDIELGAAADGLEFLARWIRQAVTI